MTEPVFFKKEDVDRMWSHGHTVSIAKDTGVYLICWDQSKPSDKRVDMACGYLEDGFYLNEELSPKEDMEAFSETWEASRAAVGGDDFCDELADPRPTWAEGRNMLAIEVTEETIEMWWATLPEGDFTGHSPFCDSRRQLPCDCGWTQDTVRQSMAWGNE